jgi:EAL domain-containing protein (putative c-di-GMP-specific phosphodiesterase class I)
MSAFAHERLELESGLRRALQNQEFELHFQPKVEVTTNQTKSVEALIRWRHPERGLQLPSAFIPFAEETGLIMEIGEWVLREACTRAREWQQGGQLAMRVAVNLSARQFRQMQLVEVVESALRQADLEPRFLELELTESTVMYDPDRSARVLGQLSRLGVQISIDDFGTGYSSLSALKRFPLDRLKIDRSFIHAVPGNPEDESIVRAVISLAHSLKLKVIAEGVESAAQLEFLRELGCDQYQGFHFSPPLGPEDFPAWLRTRQEELRGLTESDFLQTHSRLSLRAVGLNAE